MPTDVAGTPFQQRVWRAVSAIPAGETRSYTDVAEAIGAPRAARAVARAVASNRVALLVPCHRVVPRVAGGGAAERSTGGYRWGAERKRALLARELLARERQAHEQRERGDAGAPRRTAL